MAARDSPADLQDNDALLRMTARIGANLIITGRLFAFRKNTTLQIDSRHCAHGARQNSTSADLTILREARKLLKYARRLAHRSVLRDQSQSSYRGWFPRHSRLPGLPNLTVQPALNQIIRRLPNTRWQGNVLSNVTIDELGHVVMAKTNQPAPYNAEAAAIDAVKKWTMDPATRDGKLVRVGMPTLVNFRTDQ